MKKTDNIFEKIKSRLEMMPTYNTENGYFYFVYPYKGISPIDDKEIKYLAEVISSKISKEVDMIFTVETDGIFTALPVAMLLKKPLVVARSFDYRMNKPFHFTQKTGYHERELYFHFDPQKVKNVAIIDCVLSTGGTIRAVMDLFKKLGIKVEGIYTVINKINYSNAEFIGQIKGSLFCLYDVEIKNSKILVERSKHYR